MDNIIGKRVTHSVFGRGEIISYRQGKIVVRFVENDVEKKFLFPDVFRRFMYFENVQLQNEVNRQIKPQVSKYTENHRWISPIQTVIRTADGYLQNSEPRNVDFPHEYSDPWNQACYVVRYLFAYAFEYEQLYMTIIRMGLETDNIKVLSLGCGAMTDAWSLNSAMLRYRLTKTADYTGVDRAVWNPLYTPKIEGPVSTIFANTSAQEFLESLDEVDYDIIVFPKSIGDIGVHESILSAFERIKKKTFYLAVSMISYEDGSRKDIDLVKLIKSRVLSSGYAIEKQIIWDGVDHSISSDWNNIKHPIPIDEVERLTGRSPILKRNYEKDIIIKFNRRI